MKNLISFIKITGSIIIVLACPVSAEPADTTLEKIRINRETIHEAARKFAVNPSYLAAIIYTERTLNYDWSDAAFDVALALSNKNSSIGFCQIKLKTAYFIERQFHDTNSVYFPGEHYQPLLKISQTPKELIEKLVNDRTNILYAAAYLHLMQTRWKNAGFLIDGRPDILGTLYSTGLYNNDGTERQPNPNPRANDFGNKVLQAIEMVQPIMVIQPGRSG